MGVQNYNLFRKKYYLWRKIYVVIDTTSLHTIIFTAVRVLDVKAIEH